MANVVLSDRGVVIIEGDLVNLTTDGVYSTQQTMHMMTVLFQLAVLVEDHVLKEWSGRRLGDKTTGHRVGIETIPVVSITSLCLTIAGHHRAGHSYF